MRFPQFSGDWKKTTYGNVSTSYSGGTPRSSNPNYYGGAIPFIRSGEIHGNKTELFLTESGLRESAAKMVKKGDILLALYGATSGQIDRSRIDGAINQAILCISPGIDPDFLCFSWQSKVDVILRTYLQGGQGNLSAEIYKQINLFVPSEFEQNKIASLMRLTEMRIEAQNKIIEEKERLIKVLNDRLYEEAPKKRIRFSKISSSFNGLSGKSSEDFGTGYPFVTYLSILKNRVVPNEGFGYVSVKQNECQNLLRYGDTLLTLSSETPEEVGVASVYLGELTPLYLNSFSLGLRFNDFSFIDPQYAPWLFATSAFRKHIFPFAQGSTRYNLNVSAFMNSEFEIPNLEDQQAFSRLIGTLATEIETNRKVLEEFRRAKKYLLSAMFI